MRFRSTTQARIDEAKEELRCLREQRGGPEAKVLGVAGKHQRELRAARTKLLRKSRAQQRLEGGVEEDEIKVDELQAQLQQKRPLLAEAKLEVQQAHDELERLTKATAETERPGGEGAGVDGTEGGRGHAAKLVQQLKAFLPPSAMESQLSAIIEAAAQHEAQQKQAQQLQKNEQDAAALASGPKPVADDQKLPTADEDDGDMVDLASTTISLLDAMFETTGQQAENEDSGAAADGSTIGESNSRRAELVARLKKGGATKAKLQGVIKELKHKNAHGRTRVADAKAAAEALA